MWEEDFIQRQIRQVAAAVARVIGARDQVEARKLGVALDELDRAYDDILGTRRELLERTDAGSAVMLLGRGDKLGAYLWLLSQEAELRAARGESAAAARLRDRARLVEAAGQRA